MAAIPRFQPLLRQAVSLGRRRPREKHVRGDYCGPALAAIVGSTSIRIERAMSRHPALFTILVGGSIAAALDIAYAITWAGIHGVAATRLLQTVASGVLGEAAFAGGAPVAALGLALHFGMAWVIAAIFYIASRRLPFLSRHAVVSGLAFGIVVFAVMRLVVLPLSAFPYPVTFKPLSTITDLLSHMFLFGLPIALAARRVAPFARAPAPAA